MPLARLRDACAACSCRQVPSASAGTTSRRRQTLSFYLHFFAPLLLPSLSLVFSLHFLLLFMRDALRPHTTDILHANAHIQQHQQAHDVCLRSHIMALLLLHGKDPVSGCVEK